MPYGIILIAGLVACVLSITALNDDDEQPPSVEVRLDQPVRGN